LLIRTAGYQEVFERELDESMRSGTAAYNAILAHTHRQSLSRVNANWQAKQLSAILQCPQHEAAAEIHEQTGPTRRQVAVRILAEMAGEIRARDAKKSRRTA
jgi:hypothetical protein